MFEPFTSLINNMKNFHLLLIFAVICWFSSNCLAFENEFEEYDIDEDGDVLQQDERTQVNFQNLFDNQSITLFWEDQYGSGHKIAEIDASSEAGIETTIGHSFFATAENGIRCYPNRVKILSSKNDYSFGPVSTTEVKNRIHPAVKFLNVRTTSMNAKFRNLIPTTIHIWYEDGRGGSFQGHLELGKEYTINTYEGHTFFFTEKDDKSKELARFVMHKEKVFYVIQDPTRPAPQHMVEQMERELQFMAEYYNRTGIYWRHFYGPDGPRPPPVLHMWPAQQIGQIHRVHSDQGKWLCKGPEEECHSLEPLDFELEVISTHPKAFVISDFLSDFEASEIIRLANPKLHVSSVGSNDGGGARKSDTRTSRNSWVSRQSSAVTETLFRRAADLLNIDEKLLNSFANAEDMQVVHYVNGQKYDSHHDWGVSGYAESRFITLLLYLTDMESPYAGGETSFPKANNGTGIKVHPGKGSAVLFYNLLEDGNGDDLALHAALPVHQGEKWLANFWVWDPKRK